MNRLRRRVCVQRAEVHKPRVQIAARKYLNRFFGSHAIADQRDVVSERAQLNCPPGDPFDHARDFLRSEGDYVTDLKRPIGVQGNSGKEISQRVLQSETDDYAENCRRGEQGSDINFEINAIEDKDKENGKNDQREYVAHERRRFVAASYAKGEIEEQSIDHSNSQVDDQRQQDLP